MSLDNLTLTTGGWLVVSVIALFFHILNLQAARSDVRASNLVQNYRRPTRLVIANGAVHRNWVKVGVFTWWTFLGVLFGLFDPPRLIGFAGLMGLVVTAAAMGYIGFHETRERSVMADLLADDIAIDVLEGHDADVAEAELQSTQREQAAVHEADVAQATIRAADRMGRAMQQTAANTERIAKNTERVEPET